MSSKIAPRNLTTLFKDQLTAVGFLDESQALGVLCNTFRHHSLLFRQIIILRPPKEPLLSLRIFKDNAILPYFYRCFILVVRTILIRYFVKN